MAEEKKVTGVDALEKGFLEEAELNPIEKIEADSFNESAAELLADLEAAGIEVPAEAEKAEGETAIQEEEDAFTQVPELTPIEQMDMDAVIASPAEIEEDMKKAGLIK